MKPKAKMVSPPELKRLRDRTDRLTDVRIKTNMAANIHDHSSTKALREGVDYLFFELDLLIHQVEELKEALVPKAAADPEAILKQLMAMPLADLKIFVAKFNEPLANFLKKK